MLQMTEVIPFAGSGTIPKQVTVTIDGITALLTHNPQAMGEVKAPGKGSRIPEADVEAESGTYRMEDGTCALKGEAFRAAIVIAASAWKAKGKKTMTSLLSHIVVLEELVPLCRLSGEPISDYVIDQRRAIVMKAGVIRSRPRFNEWSCTFTIEYDPELISDPVIIVQILHDAGQRVGVGDYRPWRKGPFGRFRVRHYQISL